MHARLVGRSQNSTSYCTSRPLAQSHPPAAVQIADRDAGLAGFVSCRARLMRAQHPPRPRGLLVRHAFCKLILQRIMATPPPANGPLTVGSPNTPPTSAKRSFFLASASLAPANPCPLSAGRCRSNLASTGPHTALLVAWTVLSSGTQIYIDPSSTWWASKVSPNRSQPQQPSRFSNKILIHSCCGRQS